MKSFKPTYLYIKQHSVTGKLYFGKASRTLDNMLKYTGSGTDWKLHLKEFGNQIETLWYCLFTDKESIQEFANNCSEQWNIVKSDDWMNLKNESGVDTGSIGYRHTKETLSKMSKPHVMCQTIDAIKSRRDIGIQNGKLNKGKIRSEEIRSRISTTLLGSIRSDESRIKQSITTKVRSKSREHSDAISKALKGKKLGKQKQIECPYCSRTGGISAMKRTHFENCKYKNDK